MILLGAMEHFASIADRAGPKPTFSGWDQIFPDKAAID